MPLWGLGEYRTANLSLGRTGDELGQQDVAVGTIGPADPGGLTENPCGHEGIHTNLFLHQEPPTWLNNRAYPERQTLDDANFLTTDQSGPANSTFTYSIDPHGIGQTLEQDKDALDELNQVQGRGSSGNSGEIDDPLNGPHAGRGTGKKVHRRLRDGARGSGYHYEFEYIDSSGHHRRRFVHLVATSSDLTGKISGATSSVDWDRTYEPSASGGE
jgi:hypothetical protein